MLSQWFEIIAITHSHKQLARLSSPTNRIQFFETRRNRHVSLTDNVLRKILRCPRTLFRPTSSDIIIRITTNAANYTTTRAELIAHVRNTTFINDHLLFFPPSPLLFRNVSRTIVTFIIDPALCGKKRVCNGFQRQCRSRPVSSR